VFSQSTASSEAHTPWTNIFLWGAPWWLSAAAGISLVFYLFGSDRRAEKLFIVTLPLVYLVSFYKVSHGFCPPRFAIIMYPWIAMWTAWGLSKTIERKGWIGLGLAAALVSLTSLEGTAYVVNFALDASGNSNVFRAGRFISALPAGTAVGCLTLPVPTSFPPFPFSRYRLTTFPDMDRLNQSTRQDLPDYFIIVDDSIAEVPRYRLVSEYLPFSFGTRDLFRPEMLSPGSPALRFRIFQKM